MSFSRRFVSMGLALLLPLASAWAGALPTEVGLTVARQEPWVNVGRINLKFAGDPYIGTGTAIALRSVLTCGHDLFDPDFGWATGVNFDRSRYGSSYLVKRAAIGQYIFAGYAVTTQTYGPESNYAFSRDLGGLTFGNHLGLSTYAAWRHGVTILESGTTPVMSLGYGGETHTGRELLESDAGGPFRQRRGAYLYNSTYGIEAGMSGGPVFAQLGSQWFVLGVNVSAPYTGIGVGVRALNLAGAQFIRTYLDR